MKSLYAFIGLTLSLAALSASLQAQAPETAPSWRVGVGGGSLWAPAFPGSKDYQLMVVPDIRVAYGDTFFASVDQGIGYNFRGELGWVAGPLLKLDFGRNADGKSAFRVAGSRSQALVGFADIDSTLQAGGFVGGRWGDWQARLELLQGLNGHEGFTGSLNLDYNVVMLSAEGRRGPPTILSTGPRLLWGDAGYNDAYFGISSAASLGSGLPSYKAGAGLVSAGWSFSYVRPLGPQLTLIGIGGYDRLMGDAADSPLVQKRGSENQFTVGLFLSWAL